VHIEDENKSIEYGLTEVRKYLLSCVL